MAVTILEVAKYAGVSTATVSHVINKTRNVSKETAQRVFDAIDALGYTPNASARTLKTGKTDMIGFIVPDISNLYYATIIQQVEEVLGKHGKNLIIVNTKETSSIELSHLKNLTSGITDGVIIAPASANFDALQSLIPQRFPCISIDRKPLGCQIDSITISSYQAIRDATATLINRGHQRIGYIAGVPNISTTRDRLAAFCDTLEKYGLKVDPELIIHGDSIVARTVNAVDKLVEKNCTAILTSNSMMSEIAVYRLTALGISVGSEIDLLAFKETFPSHEVYNPLLSNCDMIIQPVLEFGKMVGERILERIANPDAPIKEFVLTSVYQPKAHISTDRK